MGQRGSYEINSIFHIKGKYRGHQNPHIYIFLEDRSH